MSDTGAAPDPFALVIQDMHLRRLQRDIQPNILTHDSSPRMALLYQLQFLPDLGTAESRRPQTHSFVWRECGGCCSSGARAITPCRVVGYRLAIRQAQKAMQRQGISAPPSDLALGTQTFELADEQHAEVAAWRDRRAA